MATTVLYCMYAHLLDCARDTFFNEMHVQCFRSLVQRLGLRESNTGNVEAQQHTRSDIFVFDT